MQDSSNKPDLDESLNVTESHDRTVRDAAAVQREKHVDEGGREPMSLWVFGACAFILLIAGLALGSAGTLFNYDETVRPGYVRAALDGGDSAGPPPAEALKVYMAKGEKIYGKCIGCHAPDGKGGGAYPALAGSDWVVGDTQKFAMIVLNGLSGPSSTGKNWGVMPAQGIGMSPTDLAAVMTYVRNSFGNSVGDVVTSEMAAEAIAISEARANAGAPTSADELSADHAKMLPGEPLDPSTMLDPITLEPVETEG
ncbi:c-type cytochrome [Haloferula rosea]|uniref:Cytochrome c n=1 Tax=Haloferula rosea TaxID=490093 RepID=A0A934VDI5_9BACT|nr:cytochrome c [Haloferula rosea]MBK1826309.1 cytochrome c [Haloferula rosea]